MTVHISNEEFEQKIKALEEENAKLRETEGVLRESEQYLQDIVNASFDGIFIHDQGKIISVNERTTQYIGYTVGELIGKDSLELFIPREDRDIIAADIQKVLDGTPTKDFEYPIIA